MQVFISHSHEDRSLYGLLCTALDSEKISHWDIKYMVAGGSLSGQLRDAIHQSSVCVFLATKKSIDSEWCKAETAAFWGAEKPVIIYLTEDDITESKLPPQFKGLLHATEPNQLIKAIKEHIATAMQESKVLSVGGILSTQPACETERPRLKITSPNHEKLLIRKQIPRGQNHEEFIELHGTMPGLYVEGDTCDVWILKMLTKVERDNGRVEDFTMIRFYRVKWIKNHSGEHQWTRGVPVGLGPNDRSNDYLIWAVVPSRDGQIQFKFLQEYYKKILDLRNDLKKELYLRNDDWRWERLKPQFNPSTLPTIDIESETKLEVTVRRESL